jgi:hypothetical protein
VRPLLCLLVCTGSELGFGGVVQGMRGGKGNGKQLGHMEDIV